MSSSNSSAVHETWGKEKVLKTGGPALKHFTVPEWETFANMGAELGARAVLVGRPVLYSLALGKAEGVVAVVEGLRSEFDAALGLVEKPTVGGIDGGVVQRLGESDLLPQSPPDAIPPDT